MHRVIKNVESMCEEVSSYTPTAIRLVLVKEKLVNITRQSYLRIATLTRNCLVPCIYKNFTLYACLYQIQKKIISIYNQVETLLSKKSRNIQIPFPDFIWIIRLQSTIL